MNTFFKGATFLALGLCLSCGDSDDGTPPSSNGGTDPFANPSATYDITFNAEFSAENFPTDYPDNARFGPIVAVAHAPSISVYEVGQMASEAFEAYVEDGDANTLAAFLTTGDEGEDVTTTVVTGTNVAGVSNETLSITVTPTNTRITFLARISPSPDWFVGVNSFDVVDGNTLVSSGTVGLQPLDAGTDSGDTYTAADAEISQTITTISSPPLVGSGLNPSIGSVTFELKN